MNIRVKPDEKLDVIPTDLSGPPIRTQRQIAELALANDMSLYLCRCYPNHAWAVCVDSNAGIAKVIESNLMQPELAYVIRLNDVKYSHKKLQKLLKRAGGEILERCRMSRERRTAAQVADAVETAPRDARGNVIMDTGNAPNWTGERNKTGKVIERV